MGYVGMTLLEEQEMLRTITLGTCVSIQGTFVKETSDGRIVVQVDGSFFEGAPIPKIEAGAERSQGGQVLAR